MSNLDRLKKYTTKEIPIVLKNEDGSDTFYFKPFNKEESILAKEVINGLVKLQKRFGKDKEKEEKELSEEEIEELSNLDKELTQKSFDLFMSLIKRNFEGIEEEVAENIVQTNSDIFFKEIVNLMPKNRSKEDLESLKKAKERMESGQNKAEQKKTE